MCTRTHACDRAAMEYTKPILFSNENQSGATLIDCLPMHPFVEEKRKGPRTVCSFCMSSSNFTVPGLALVTRS